MPECCPRCHEECSHKADCCPHCGVNVRAIIAEGKAEMREEAIEGWRRTNADLRSELTATQELVRKVQAQCDMRIGWLDACGTSRVSSCYKNYDNACKKLSAHLSAHPALAKLLKGEE